MAVFGPVAHLVERLICTEEVAGSIPVWSTTTDRNAYALRSFVVVRPDRNRKTEPGPLWAGESGS